jgi:hypothetical protein
MLRWSKKVLLWWTLRELPANIKSVAMHKLLAAIDIPDRAVRAEKIKDTFNGWKESLVNGNIEKLAELEKSYGDRLNTASKLMLAPNFPMPHFSVNQGLLDEVTKARLNILMLQEDVMHIPQIKTLLLVMALLVLILSVIANYFTLTTKLGSDFINGDQTITAIINGVFSILLTSVEVIGFFVLIHFTHGEGLKRKFAIMLGVIGAILLIAGVSITILTRAEIGSTALTNSSQSIGKIE